MAIWPDYSTFRFRFSVTGVPDAITGYEAWPAANVNTAGFNTLTVPRPITVGAFHVTCNAVTPGDTTSGAADAVLGVADYNWWVSLRSDDPALQAITVVQDDATKSGTLLFGFNLTKARILVNNPSLTTATLLNDELTLYTLYRNVWVYAQRVSDDLIVARNLLDASLSDLTY